MKLQQLADTYLRDTRALRSEEAFERELDRHGMLFRTDDWRASYQAPNGRILYTLHDAALAWGSQ